MRPASEPVVTTPSAFDALFPATGGALYGRANHGMMGSFARAGSRGRVPGLYLAGGSVHPGPGVPMATMSGRLAAARVLADFGPARYRNRLIRFPVGSS
jgi:1-hydroxycarotenoid 3,4-desaturase